MNLALLRNRPAGRHGVTNSYKNLFGNSNIPKSSFNQFDFMNEVKLRNQIIVIVLILLFGPLSLHSLYGGCNSGVPNPSTLDSTSCKTEINSYFLNMVCTPRCTTPCISVLINCYDYSTNFNTISPETGTSVTIGCLISRGCLLPNNQAINTPQYIKLNCTLIVDQDYTFYNSVIFIAGTADESRNYIDVGSMGSYTLKIDGSILRGCNESWTGIIMSSGGKLDIRNNSQIYDARYGI